MLSKVNADDLKFASVRARACSSPLRVAEDLLAAADEPTRLNGVTRAQVRVAAAKLLGDSGHDARALDELRTAVQQAADAVDRRRARVRLAVSLIAADDRSEAEALVDEVCRSIPLARNPAFSVSGLLYVLAVAGQAADCHMPDEGLRWLDAGQAAATSAPKGHRPWVGKVIPLYEAERNRILDGRVAATGTAEREEQHREQAERIAGSLAWPVLAGGHLLWWPESEYSRLVRQVPELAELLGSPWRGHTARVEHTLRAHGAANGQRPLVAGDFDAFVEFLDRFESDPRSASVMTAATEHVSGYDSPTAWPPRPRQQCW